MEFFLLILKVLVFLPFILLLIYISVRFGGDKLTKMQNGKFIRVIERVPVSKDNHLVVAKIGDKAYVLTSTAASVEIMKELSEEELMRVEKEKDNYDKICKEMITMKHKLFIRRGREDEEK